MTLPLSDSAHDSIIELLPWYVNGTLPEGEYRVVEDHLGSCAECRNGVEALSQVSHAIRNDSPAPLIPPPRTEALLDALDKPQHHSFIGSSWIPYAAAASIVLLAVTAWINLQSSTAPADSPVIFQTATSADTGETLSYVVELTFAAGTNPDSRDASLAAIGAVGGTSLVGEGTYRITLTPMPASLAELEQRIDSIEARPDIASARVVAVQLPVE